MKKDRTSQNRPLAPEEVGVGTQLGSYKLQALIGEGGMGRVFQAKHIKLGRTVAIKLLHSKLANRPEMVKRFFREARVINEINHQNIVEVTDFVEEEGRAYCVMEYLTGSSLEKLIKKDGPFPIARTVWVMIQVCDALQAAHEHGVIHRDLKPDNIFVAKKGRDEFVKVLDFGVVKLLDPDGTNYTTEGMVLGTPIYMAPEQANGLEVDVRADMYAAGVVMYRMLTGKVPFDASTFGELLAKLSADPVPPLPDKTPRGEPIPPKLAAAVMKCLAKNPKDRFQKMSALSEVLQSLGQPAPKKRKAGKRSRSRAPWVWLAALLGSATAGAWAFQTGRLSPLIAWGQARLHPAAREVPAPPPPRPPPPAPPPAPARISLEVSSRPPGAQVVRVDTGESLGKTPLRAEVVRKAGATTQVRLVLDGYDTSLHTVDLGQPSQVAVTLTRRKPPPGRPKKPVKTKATKRRHR